MPVLLAASIETAQGGSAIPASFSLQKVLEEISTPEELAQWMSRHFEFREDESLVGSLDYWQRPEEFLRRRQGDCEDYALFAQYILQKMGIEAYVVSLYGERGYAHTITVFKDHGRFRILNEDRLLKDRAQTIEEALSRVYAGWVWAAIAEERYGRGRMLQPILNPV